MPKQERIELVIDLRFHVLIKRVITTNQPIDTKGREAFRQDAP